MITRIAVHWYSGKVGGALFVNRDEGKQRFYDLTSNNPRRTLRAIRMLNAFMKRAHGVTA